MNANNRLRWKRSGEALETVFPVSKGYGAVWNEGSAVVASVEFGGDGQDIVKRGLNCVEAAMQWVAEQFALNGYYQDECGLALA